MDCSEFEPVEQVPGKVAGKPVIKGTRILADIIAEDYELGAPIEEIQESFPSLPLETMRRILEFAHKLQPFRERSSRGNLAAPVAQSPLAS
jgi:uncharacterized protein (DUF433 family)